MLFVWLALDDHIKI